MWPPHTKTLFALSQLQLSCGLQIMLTRFQQVWCHIKAKLLKTSCRVWLRFGPILAGFVESCCHLFPWPTCRAPGKNILTENCKISVRRTIYILKSEKYLWPLEEAAESENWEKRFRTPANVCVKLSVNRYKSVCVRFVTGSQTGRE